MSRPKHTPGPWNVTRFAHGSGPYDQFRICFDHPTLTHIPVSTANAHLIASAPEMLDALEYLVSQHSLANVDPKDLNPDTETDEGLSLIKARQVITKAKGES